jgi:hypothetical protein
MRSTTPCRGSREGWESLLDCCMVQIYRIFWSGILAYLALVQYLVPCSHTISKVLTSMSVLWKSQKSCFTSLLLTTMSLEQILKVVCLFLPDT